ncbi:MAG TPA: sugar ABC transporter permease [Pseudonocardiaceae bacterium]
MTAPTSVVVPAGASTRRRRSAVTAGQARGGWVLSAPAVLALLVFIVAPVLMAIWVSLLDWDGQSSPFSGRSEFVGAGNYSDLLAENTLAHRDFMTSVRNTLYYVLVGVPAVTVLAFGLAMVVNQRLLRGRSVFRTIFYFPSVTSSVAVSITFLFLFQGNGAVNAVLGAAGVDGPRWFTDSRGVLHVLLGTVGLDRPAWTGSGLGGLTWWDWLSGPSVAMCAIIALTVWSSSGTFMLFFLAGLQNIPGEVEEAATIDGASSWQRFRYVILPMMRRSITLVVTLALIGSWQVFDQVYILSQGSPAKTTLTPAYLSYARSFRDGDYGLGAAIAFTLFAIIIVLTVLQRWVGRERDR